MITVIKIKYKKYIKLKINKNIDNNNKRKKNLNAVITACILRFVMYMHVVFRLYHVSLFNCYYLLL